MSDLANILYASSHKDRDFYLGVVEQLEKLDVSEATTAKLLQSILSHKKLKEISLAAYDVTEGRMEPSKLDEMLHGYLEQQPVEERQDEFQFISDDLEELVNSSIHKPGLRWRLKTLNQMLGSLRLGDFGFLFARPETGKTTILASEVTFMAEQLGDGDGPIIWFNNEEQGNKVKLRCYQASLGLTLPQLLSDLKGHKAEYIHKTRGKILLYDSGSITKRVVEQICEQYSPSLVIFDQIDKIQGFEADREDLHLGKIYTWARELAKKYAPVIGICQADGTGEGVKWLNMGHVANAKTAKQAEADWIVGIGKVNDPGYENVRYLHASKNKLMGDDDSVPDLRHGKKEVLINASIARYEDIN